MRIRNDPEYLANVERFTNTTIFGSGCNSWYLDAEGIPATWPWSYKKFEEAMSAPNFDAFDMQ